MSQKSTEVTQPYRHGSGYSTATPGVSLHSEPSVNQGDIAIAEQEQMSPVEEPVPWRQLPLRMRIRHDPYLRQLLSEPIFNDEEDPEMEENPKYTPSESESNTLATSKGSNELQKQAEDSTYDYKSRPKEIIFGGPGHTKFNYVERVLEAITRRLQNHTALQGRRFYLAWIERAREAFELDQLSEDAVENSDWSWGLMVTIPNEELRRCARIEIIEFPIPDFYVCLEKLEALVNELFPDD